VHQDAETVSNKYRETLKLLETHQKKPLNKPKTRHNKQEKEKEPAVLFADHSILPASLALATIAVHSLLNPPSFIHMLT